METGTAIPVVGHNIVVGSKKHKPVKILERPPHTVSSVHPCSSSVMYLLR